MEFIIGKTVCRFLILAIWFWDIQDVLPEKTEFEPKPHAPGKFMLSDPPMGLFDPIEIAPAVIPRNPYPVQPLSPMYPSFPRIYEPILSGKCPINFSSMSVLIDKTASDCSAPLAALVGNVICCPQVNSLMHIFQGSYVSKSNLLVFQQATANYCFSDLINILVSRGANSTISTLCSVKSSNLTGGSCPVKDLATFEKIVNTSKLLESCSSVDQLKECCRPTCQPAIMEAAVQISLGGAKASMIDGSRIPGSTSSINAVNDCKGVVYSWLSNKISPEVANTAFRILSGCKVNKVCPLEFEETTPIMKACGGSAPSNLSCCSSLHTYIESIQRQMLITNRQAINCATLFGSMLQKGGIMANIYELCKVELKDFSLQSYGQQGCLLRSLPADIVFDNITGFSFTCDLSDNIAAPWPSSSSLSSLSLCAPEMSLPALPVPLTSVSSGCHNIARTIAMLAYVISSLLL